MKKTIYLTSESIWEEFISHCQVLSLQAGKQIGINSRLEEIILAEIQTTKEKRKELQK